ncbi:MAG: GNAT family N-acetyltransferase [bacterium]|nr:GNAT family N-acetyltransferase [bacterium]
MEASFTLRNATNKDSPAILKLIFDIWIHEYGFSVNPEETPDLHDIDAYYLEKGGLFLVALDPQGQLIGTIACAPLGEKNYALKRMFVHKDCRGKGVAGQLLQALFEQKVLGQPGVFYLSTKEDQAIAAKNFYLKNGFKVVEKKELPPTFPLFYEDDLFMKKTF